MYDSNYSKVVSRNYTDASQVSDAGIPRSGQDMSYRTKSSGVIGRLIPLSYQHLMPGSKFSGKSTVAPTLDQMTTPIAPDMLMRVHNFVVPYFSVNRDFRDIMTANPRNDFNKDQIIGAFQMTEVVRKVFLMFGGLWSYLGLIGNVNSTLTSLKTITPFSSADNYNPDSFISSTILDGYSNLFLEGAISDLRVQVASRLGTYSSVTADVASLRANMYSVYSCIIDFFFGEHSLFDELGYPYISHSQMRDLFLGTHSYGTLSSQEFVNILVYGSKTISDEPMLSDMALRCYHAVWIEFYRNVQLQPRSSEMDYHKWDNSLSLSSGSSSSLTRWQFFMLVKHICPWNEDLFTSAQLDDIMRRVYLPVSSSSDSEIVRSGSTNTEYNGVIPGTRFMTLQNISYLDEFGQQKRVQLPIPSILNRALSSLDYSDDNIKNVSGFDLFSLKRAHMLERYLKRGHYFGDDEYRDIIKGQYDVDISDLRLNRPHFLGGNTEFLRLDQHISQSGDTPTNQSGQTSGSFGQRIVTGNGHLESNTFTDFAEDWCMTLTLFSIIPDVQYDPLCIQNTQIYVSDFPIPVLCENFETVIPTMAIARNKYFPTSLRDFGHAPSAYQYRSRVNEVHGRFLDEFSDYTAARFFGNSDETSPKLNSAFLECRPYLGFFVNTILLDGQFYYVADHEFFVENPLPAPVEVI